MLSVWPSHLLLAQNYYDLEKINVKLVWPSHHSLAQNYYDLEKINVECQKLLQPQKYKCRVVWPSPPSHQELLQPRKYKC